MNFLTHYAAARRPVETCVVGSGGFGRSFLAQALRIPLVKCRVAVDREAGIAADALRSIGLSRDQFAVCETPEQAAAAWQRGLHIAAGDVSVVLGLPLDLLIEATGHPEAGARHARLAIEAGLHVALTSKEVDSVVGPGLAYLAQQKGRVVTPVDGDQPSLLIGLVTWAQTLGLEIVAAGKSSEYDFVFDAKAEVIESNGQRIPAPGFADLWTLGRGEVQSLARARAEACAALPQRAVPDLCELLVVANSTGLVNDRKDLHAPIARITEVPTTLVPREAGGLLAQPGTLDVFHCLRAPDEVSLAGGVFVVVRCDDEETWRLLDGKGHVLSRDKKHAMLSVPRHLLGLEAAISVLDAVVHGRSSGAQQPRPVLDLVARATRTLKAGTRLEMGGHHHNIAGTVAELIPAAPLGDDAPVPFYLAANRTLVRDVAAGEPICLADIAVEAGSELLALRRQQDAQFFPQGR
ncbi:MULTISPECIES: NAD(P)H-dependent oxidoreductase [Ramlibacter]|uniref:Flagellar biosynthesis protein FlgA n=1 Tax=Ramlibacter pinisoli TaxID=2682844 RepID=A0A6N8IWX3_9BURK|nr:MULTISPECIES: flagellar biosynthesis protein FlgA [Ramlibacter]MBA2961536.1 flagellar biosynthesis protein FlgA [Ramlibacter sp. CGMCC 1.13660]MVQ31479.1 flagellar biosynthesis protein FlgA [Ramlibacter pinisoli]